jgi:NAD(P)-dependent dehydrogenase (short-subunit alcohol dehydrogenase family)
VLVNNAGLGTAVPATTEPPDEFRRVVDVNVFGSYWMAQACARVMARGSSIINLSSVIAFTTAELPQAAYSASKAAIIGLTRDLAQEWTGRRGIRVNAIAPGYFPTEMTAQYKPGYMDTMIERRVPMGRAGELEECAAAVVFLASDAASYITGIVLPIDGGMLAT